MPAATRVGAAGDQQVTSLALDLATGQALHQQVDVDRPSLGDSDGIAAGAPLTAGFTEGDVGHALNVVVQSGEVAVPGIDGPYSVHRVAKVPEPGTLALWLGGLLLLAGPVVVRQRGAGGPAVRVTPTGVRRPPRVHASPATR